MSEPEVPAPPRRARVATAIVFAVHAAVFAAWTPHIPEVKDRLGLDDGTLGLTLLGAPVGSVVAMLLGDRWVARFGAARVVGRLAVVGAVGMAVALVLGEFWPALAGFGAFGLGLACIVPVAFSAAAAQSDAHAAQAIAGVATAGWTGFLLGPPLIGLLAHASSQSWALAVLPILCLGVVFGARSLGGRPSP